MSKGNKGDKLKESPKDIKKAMDLNDVEMVFGTPDAPKTDIKPDLHSITNEKRQEKGPAPKLPVPDNDVEVIPPTEPLLEPDRNRPKPPLAGPEVDDLDEKPADATPYPGIDDGLLEPSGKVPDIHENGTPETGTKDSNGTAKHDDGVDTEDGKWPWRDQDEPDYPYDINGFGPRFGLDDRPGSPMIPGSIPDVNTYQQKKNLAQGMMDLALLSANANQLRYVLESSTSHPYFYPSLTFISLSILLQVAVGVGLIMNSRYNVKDEKDICKADKINNMTILGIFLITIVNVFITSFSVATPTTVSSMNQQMG